MCSLEVSGTDDEEENITEYAILSLSRIVAANQLIFAYIWMSFHTSVHVRRMTSPPIISHNFLSLHANIEIMSIA